MTANRRRSQETRFSDVVLLCEELGKTTSRLKLVDLIATFLRKIPAEEVPSAVALIIGHGRVEGNPLEVSGRTLWRVLADMVGPVDRDIWQQAVDVGEAAQMLWRQRGHTAEPELTVREVIDFFQRIAAATGKGSRQAKEALLQDLFGRATSQEVKYLVKNLVGEMRHGVSEGLLVEAIAKTAGADVGTIRHAYMVGGDLGKLAQVAIVRGKEGLQEIGFRLFHPLKPMLAQTARDVTEAFEVFGGELALEQKLDGARVQIHAAGEECRLYSRRLKEITASLPDVVELVRAEVRVKGTILEGEVIAVAGHEPLPFQELMRRFRRVHEVERLIREVPVRLYLFDVLYLDGELLTPLPYRERWQILEGVKGCIPCVARLLPRHVKEGEAFFHDAVQQGSEGVMAKGLPSVYAPGIRGRGWLKIKKTVSLDLVIIAADWGYGRRHGWLSNYHLAAWDRQTGRVEPVGKTFKGLTDAEFTEMTRRLLALKTVEEGGTVWVKPQVVVEVLFSDIQKSPYYPCGLALRFARITRIRDDKAPEEADNLQTMRDIYARQLERGKLEQTKRKGV